MKRRLHAQQKADLDALPDADARKAALADLWDGHEIALRATLATASKHLRNLGQPDEDGESSWP